MNDNEMLVSVDEMAARVPDGALLAIPREHSGSPNALARALVRRGAKDLRLFTVTSQGYAADLLVGAGCVTEIASPGISLGEYGPARRFIKAVREGSITIKDSTCPAQHAQLQASEKGVPFMPLRGIIGSDLAKHRDDWLIQDNPFAENDPIVLLPAVKPDFGIFHASMMDRNGNVWIGKRHELKTIAHAAVASLVTVERLYDGDFLEDDRYAAGTIPSLYLDSVAEAEAGAWPNNFWDGPSADAEHLKMYAQMSKTDEGFQEYVDRFVFAPITNLAADTAAAE